MGGHPVTRESHGAYAEPGDPRDPAAGATAAMPGGGDAETVSARPQERPRHRLAPRLLLAVLVGVLIALAGQLVTIPYVILRPGPAIDILAAPGSARDGKTPVVEVEGATTYPTEGALFFTTVAQYGGPDHRPAVWDVGRAWLDPDSRVLREEDVFPPDVTQEQVKQGGVAAMSDSQHEATAVVLRSLGRRVTEKATIVKVVPDGAAAHLLEADDVVTHVDGTRITRASQISELINASAAPRVRLTVERQGQVRTVEVAPRTTDGRRLIGIVVAPVIDTDVDVTFHAGDVGGPSAGMMFALALYDTLTPGPLTGGQRIAGTGTLDSAGKVGPIGGIQQKMVGARDAGAAFFLAPAANCAEVVGHVPDGLRVTPVATFDAGRSAVEAIAAGRGESLPSCPSAG